MSGTAPPRVLIVVASRHGGTRRMAEAFAEELRAGGLVAEVVDAASAPPPDGSDAVVIGSAVYLDRWLSPRGATLPGMPPPSSRSRSGSSAAGPPGDASADAPAGVEAVRLMTGARHHLLAPGPDAVARWADEVRAGAAA